MTIEIGVEGLARLCTWRNEKIEDALLRGAPPVLGEVVAISDQEERDAKEIKIIPVGGPDSL